MLAEEVLGLEMAGVFAHPEPTRIYPAGPVASHVTGFVNIDGDGQEGLELVYDEQLRGIPGHAEYERDRAGHVIPQGYTNIVPAIPGHRSGDHSRPAPPVSGSGGLCRGRGADRRRIVLGSGPRGRDR